MKQKLIKLGGLLGFILLLVSITPGIAFANAAGTVQTFFQQGGWLYAVGAGGVIIAICKAKSKKRREKISRASQEESER